MMDKAARLAWQVFLHSKEGQAGLDDLKKLKPKFDAKTTESAANTGAQRAGAEIILDRLNDWKFDEPTNEQAPNYL